MDGANEATPSNTIYNLDGIAYANGSTVAFPFLQFKGNAAFAGVSTVSNQPLSPLNRSDGQNFPQGFYMKHSDRRIPQTGTSGPMIPDSVFVSQSVTISDVNFYLASNHTFDSDMEVTLVAPTGDSVNVCFDFSMLDQNDNIITLFDDQADSALTNSVYTSAAPRVRPQNSLNTAFLGRNAQGWWRLKINDDAGGDTGRVYFWGVQINNQSLVGVEEVAGGIPEVYSLDQNYPNPFNPTTTIQFSIPKQSPVTLRVFDILGREVRTLVNEVKNAGAYRVQFDATGLASGTYFYRMEAGSYLETRKLLLLK
jgi:subtilisin-like proprotein convertase family protein